ncbi:maltokinase [Friedmanniella endophytica]|uniref:Maltokinase n=1 Tax=Microlunatus kandeliicorticis TaxID=1759536 RepID=A0A7W3IUM0_9ACTN|nr:phosphotransferase [Microlunatus kandeliicorticis]MBA8795504.1 maltokinase [Microlunatus kandeliicorticis]
MTAAAAGPSGSSGPGDPRRDALREHLAGARWFGGKGRDFRVADVVDLGWLTPADFVPAVRIEIAEVRYAGSAPDVGLGGPDDQTDLEAVEYYQLLMAYRPAGEPGPGAGPSAGNGSAPAGIVTVDDPERGRLVGSDGVQDSEARRVLLVRLLGEYAATSADGSLAFRLRDSDRLTADLPSTVFGGQQSNTSLMYGDVAMLKLFRRLELGRNLDIEAHQVLSDAGIEDVATLYGWLEGSWRTAAGVRHSADFGMVVEKLREATDGWELALERLRAGADFTAESEDLGRALAEIHRALGANFATDTIAGDELADVMVERLAVATEAAPALAEHADGLRRCFDELRGRDLPAQRVHGDFHLAQTLHTPTGWKIIDFEGEPAKTMAERVAPDNPWRDVAGLLRSYEYAAASVPGDDGGESARAWAQACSTAMLAGYRRAAGLPAEDDEATALLRAYTADKAVYEVVYEVRNRPDWVHIPLGAVAALAATPQSHDHPHDRDQEI